MPKVLISDSMSPDAEKIFLDRGVEVDVKTGLKPGDLKKIISEYDGLTVRSSTKVTADILETATNLKVIGRAGIGVDNIDIPAATAKGIIVMNTPFGNSITTAEHAIAMMMALAREIHVASASTHAGNWEKNRFMGVEMTGKTLGLIGCGNVGSVVADRVIGLKMKVAAYDPFLTPERAEALGVEKVELDELFKRSDFITLHTPLTNATRNIIDAKAMAKMKRGVRIINCARGGLVVEADLKAAIEGGQVAGAAVDVFEEEPPAKDHILLGMEQIVVTPHLGASTIEAQETVALQVAKQMSDFLLTGAVMNAINMPSLSAEDAPKLTPYMKLAEQLGSFAGQLTETAIKKVSIEYEGRVAELNTKPLTQNLLMGLLSPLLEDVNMVSAPAIARERGIDIVEKTREKSGDYNTFIRLSVTTEKQTRSVAGTLFTDDRPRIVECKGIQVEAALAPFMLYITNNDRPGLIGAIGSTLGEGGVNIATFHLGRDKPGGNAIALIEVDDALPEAVLRSVSRLPNVMQVKALQF
jgi:D-3-phosphoglycerate dehydrogenase